jgi:hypothetical protein
MHADVHVEQEENIEDDEVEFTDLDQPDNVRNSKFSGLAVSALQWRSTSKRRYLRLASSLCFLLLLVILLSLSNTLSFSIVKSFKTVLFPPTPSSSIASNPIHDGVACLADTASSPDSRYIAVLGYYKCPQEGYELGLVKLYDARSKQLVNQVTPDTVIESALDRSSTPLKHEYREHPPPDFHAQVVPPLIYYWHITWSPDGRRLALTFEITAQWPPEQGLVLINVQNWEMKVLIPHQA